MSVSHSLIASLRQTHESMVGQSLKQFEDMSRLQVEVELGPHGVGYFVYAALAVGKNSISRLR